MIPLSFKFVPIDVVGSTGVYMQALLCGLLRRCVDAYTAHEELSTSYLTWALNALSGISDVHCIRDSKGQFFNVFMESCVIGDSCQCVS